MSAQPPSVETPYAAASREPVDPWSRDVFAALSGWAEARQGRWIREEDQTLVLEIAELEGEAIERVRLFTSNEEITVEFGRWHTHLPELAMDSVGAVSEAVDLISRWLSGAVRTATFLDDAGRLCGATLVEADTPMPPDPGDVIAGLGATRVEIRSVRPPAPQTLRLDPLRSPRSAPG